MQRWQHPCSCSKSADSGEIKWTCPHVRLTAVMRAVVLGISAAAFFYKLYYIIHAKRAAVNYTDVKLCISIAFLCIYMYNKSCFIQITA